MGIFLSAAVKARIFLLFKAIRLNDLTHIKERVCSYLPVLVDELEVINTPAQFGVQHEESVAQNSVAVQSSYRCVAAQTFGVHLAEKHAVDVVREVVRYLAPKVGLQHCAVCKRQSFGENGQKLREAEMQSQVAVSVTVNQVGSVDQ